MCCCCCCLPNYSFMFVVYHRVLPLYQHCMPLPYLTYPSPTSYAPPLPHMPLPYLICPSPTSPLLSFSVYAHMHTCAHTTVMRTLMHTHTLCQHRCLLPFPVPHPLHVSANGLCCPSLVCRCHPMASSKEMQLWLGSLP